MGKRKTPDIPPLIVDDFLVSEFTTKANLFNNFFTSLCSPVGNSSRLPNFCYKSQKQISNFEINQDDILYIIKTLNLNKAHGWDYVSIRMIQLCSESIVTFKIYIWVIFNSWYFPREPEERQHYSSPQKKKKNKNCLKNYRPKSCFLHPAKYLKD